MGRHSLEEHVGEVELRVEGESLADLFTETAHAIGEVLGHAVPDDPGVHRGVTLEAPDRNALLVDWMNELVYLTDRNERIYEARIEVINDRMLKGTLHGRSVANLRQQIKAATFHGLEIHDVAGHLVANVVLDV